MGFSRVRATFWAPVARVGALWLLCCAAGACDDDERRRRGADGPAPAAVFSRPAPAQAPARADAGRGATTSAPPERTSEAPSAPAASGAVALDATQVSGGVFDPLVVDALVDVGPAGPATATELGVVMVNRANRSFVARLAAPLSSAARPEPTRLEVLSDDTGPFPLAHGPALWRGRAYWISRGRLLRQTPGAQSAPLVLRDDARVGTRVAVPVGAKRHLRGLPHLAAYIARPSEPDLPLTAKLWVEDTPEPLRLTDDTASAHSVALAATADGVEVLFLEARTGMSTVHVRRVRFPKSGGPRLGADRIVWVGGPSRPTTELLARGAASSSVAFMTLERDMMHFGLVELDVPWREVPLPLEPDWLLYANGIEPAPLASAELCKRAVVAFARPSSAVPHAPQELVLATPGARSPPLVLARSRAFFDISLAPLAKGALLVYVADKRTWARTLRCLG